MGIKNLNRFLSDNCTKKSIRKQHMNSFINKTIVIDTSIYMYKYQSENALLENMKRLIQILLYYRITPIFVFDGQAPPEKKDLIRQRAQLKHAAEAQYNELLLQHDSTQPLPDQQQLDEKLAYLKTQFVRIHATDIVNVKTLIDEMGVEYLEAEGEADQLCAFLVKSKKAWRCLSDDMDMFVYGCAHVLRNFNLTQHTVIYYDLQMVLIELEMPMHIFKEILVLSGTDYNIHSKTSLDQTIAWLYKYRQYCKNQHNIPKKPFYEWLTINTNYIDNYEQLMHIFSLF